MAAAIAATWGEFQSLFQLSVALNAAFAVLHDVLPQARASKSHDLGVRANRIGAHDLAAELFLLETRHSEGEAKIQIWIFRYVGPVCLAAGIVALIFLAVSSFCYNAHIHWFFQAYATFQYLPFAIGAVLALRAVIYDSISLTGQLDAFEAQLKVAERAFNRAAE
jgi:hypothetical protein